MSALNWESIDIAVSGERALRLIELALAAGIKRIGANQKGAARSIHLDVCDDKTSPAICSYKNAMRNNSGTDDVLRN